MVSAASCAVAAIAVFCPAVAVAATASPPIPAPPAGAADAQASPDAASMYASVFSTPSFEELAALADLSVKDASALHGGMRRFAEFSRGADASAVAIAATAASTPVANPRAWRTRSRTSGAPARTTPIASSDDECHQQCVVIAAEHVKVTQQLCPLMADHLQEAAAGVHAAGAREALRSCQEDATTVAKTCALHCGRQDL